MLSVSPLHTTVEEDTDDLETTEGSKTDDNQREASYFKAETHLKHFKKIFEYYNYDFDAWTKAQLADNPSVNKKLARLGGFPHLACNNYLLNSEMNSMYENMLKNGLGKTMNTCHEIMLATRGSIKNSACLHLGTELKAVLCGRAKWNGWMYMMDRFVKIRDELITASLHKDANIPIDSLLPFNNKAIKCAKIMDDDKFTAVSLQKILLTLKECCELIDMLISETVTGKNNRESPWYKNQFGKDYIHPHSEKLSGDIACITDGG